MLTFRAVYKSNLTYFEFTHSFTLQTAEMEIELKTILIVV